MSNGEVMLNASPADQCPNRLASGTGRSSFLQGPVQFGASVCNN